MHNDITRPKGNMGVVVRDLDLFAAESSNKSPKPLLDSLASLHGRRQKGRERGLNERARKKNERLTHTR